MRTTCVRLLAILFALSGVAGGARAQEPDQVNVTMSHEFVVAGKTLPAGTYKVFRASANNNRELIMSSVENREGVIVIATDVEQNRGDEAHATLEVVGEQFVLTKIETAQHVFSIPVSKTKDVQVAKAAGTPAGTSGSN